MTIIIKGDLILEKDTEYDESLIVEGNISGKDGTRYNLKVNGDLNCGNLNCLDLKCYNLKCYNLNCADLKCYNLKCFDLNCDDLNCENLSYYAVALAYRSFKCKSIKGRRENSKHFCLDKEIEIIEKPKCKECGREI